MSRSRASAKAVGARFERTIADHLATALGSEWIDRRVKTGAQDRARNQARFEHLDERVAAEHGRSWALAQLAVPVGKRARVMPWPPPGAPLSAEQAEDAPVWG